MRRDIRRRNNQEDELNMKIIRYSSIGIAILAVIVFGLLVYSKSLNNEVKEGTLTSEQISNILNSTGYSDNTTSASTEIGKSVNEIKLEQDKDNTIKNNATTNSTKTNTKNNTNSKSKTNSKENGNSTTQSNNVLSTDKVTAANVTNEANSNIATNEENAKGDTAVELCFEKPVEGEIVKDFAIDNLIYSETLQEWTTHTGIDIKAEKTSIVKCAEAGTVKSIKNDPRYGLTIIVEHANGFQTVYSNLLTSEFVVEGEKVEKGQSLGTVGNTAAFEIADEAHLHFEVLKDSVQVNPNIYLK